MRVSLNLQCLYPGLPFEEALARVKALGFDTVERWSVPSEETEGLARILKEQAVSLSTFCPHFFILNDESRHDEYELSLKAALAQAKRFGCHSLITQVGQDNGKGRAAQHGAIVAGLVRMLPLLEEAGVTLLVEPLNDAKDHKGYYLTDSNEGFEIINEVGSKHVRLLYDIYHQLHMGEDVQQRIFEHLPLIGHFHVAGFPGRDANIFGGGYDYTQLLGRLAESGTGAPLGLELFAQSANEADALLAQVKQYL